MAQARWNRFAPETPTWQIVLRCLMGGVAAGIVFGVVGSATGLIGPAGGVFFACFFAAFLVVTNLRQMRRGPWA